MQTLAIVEMWIICFLLHILSYIYDPFSATAGTGLDVLLGVTTVLSTISVILFTTIVIATELSE